ncbi:MAG: FtsX-like permease family protein [Bryobacteraceae bacterium]
MERAQRELESLFTNEHRNDAGGVWRLPRIYPLAEQFAYLTGPNLRLSLMVLFGTVTFVLLIACVNIANLLLGRSLWREKEIAIRAALGSGRLRLIRQLLTEGLVLSFAGALLGVVLALAAVRYFRALNPIEMPPGNPVSVNLQVLGFAAVLAIATALLFGLVPAFKASSINLINALKASGRSASFSPAARAFGKVLVAAEVMLSLALLVGAGLLIESVSRLASVPLGFRIDRVLTVPLELPSWNYSKSVLRARFYRELLAGISTRPGFESAAFASTLPLNNGRGKGAILTIQGKPEPVAAIAPRDVGQSSITADYFRIMGVPLERGRLFEDSDREESAPVAIVNEALVRKYFPHESPIGKHIKLGEPGSSKTWLTVVGVAANEKDRSFFQEMTWEEIPLVFRPINQDPPLTGTLVLRAARDDIALGAAIRKQIRALDPTVPVGEMQTMNERLSQTLAYPRFRAVILGTFAGLALLLAVVGLYGVLSQLIAQRTREFGVRMALGAGKRDVLMLVIKQGMLLTGAGLIAGLAIAWCLTRFLSSLLYGVKATDPWTLAGVSLLLVGVSFLATYLPARRAAQTDPMAALRYE